MTQTMEIEDVAIERKTFFMQLYQQAFPLVAKYVREMGGSFEEAKDVFQDALVIYYETTTNSSLQVQYSERAYLLGIARHCWAKKNKANSLVTSLPDSLDGIAMEEDTGTTATDKLLDLLHTSGKKCIELL